MMLAQYTIEFPAGFWSPGAHTFSIRLVDTYPGDEIDMTFGPYPFTVSETAPLYPGHVGMFIDAPLMSLPGFTPVPDNTINPAQGTLYQSMVGWDMTQYTVAAAKAEIADTTAYFQPDGGAWITAYAWPLTSWCATLTPANQGGTFTAWFHRSWGPKLIE